MARAEATLLAWRLSALHPIRHLLVPAMCRAHTFELASALAPIGSAAPGEICERRCKDGARMTEGWCKDDRGVWVVHGRHVKR